MQWAIEARGVGKSFGSGADRVGLHDLSLSVPAGQVLALLGHNGAGKTTAVRGLTTLAPFDHGSARVARYDVATHPQRVRERVALVGQVPAVDEQLTAVQNLVLFGRLRGLGRAAARGRATELIEDFGLTGAESRPVQGFSGGMRRRLDVAASLIVQPDVLFVDEPTTGLDPAARRDLWHTLRALVAQGTTVLLTTQYLEEADALADHIVLLAHGRVVAEGTSDELKSRLGHPVIRLRFAAPDHAERAVPVLSAVDPDTQLEGGMVVTLTATRHDALPECLRALAQHDLSPTEVALRKPSLDEVFLSLTHDRTDVKEISR